MRYYLILLFFLFCHSVGAHASGCDLVIDKGVTIPSLNYFQAPRGPSADEVDTLSFRLENVSAKILARFGFDVIHNPSEIMDGGVRDDYLKQKKVEGLSNERTPDYMIEGRIFDNYAPETNLASLVVDGIFKKIKKKQTHRVVVNLMKNQSFKNGDWTLEDLQRLIKERASGQLWEVVVVHGKESKATVEVIYPDHFVLPPPK